MTKRQRMQALTLAATVALWGAPASAASLDVAYDISLLGLPIGSATLNGKVEAERYQIEIKAKMIGLAGSITGGRGAATATGTAQGGNPVSSSFAVTAANSKEQRTVRLAIEKNAVSAFDITPPLEPKPDRVALAEAHKKGIVDPISALLMPVQNGDPRTACNRRIPIFDGAARYDIALSYAGTKPVEAEGFKGEAIVCHVRYTPIAGHRNRKPVRYMAENKNIEVWLAPIAGTSLMLPVYISMKTMVGTAVIEATKYATEPGTTATVRR